MPQVTRYHHGDLRAALVGAGLELARDGGPDAITVREVTRIAGVSPAAAYRHFDDLRALTTAVALAAQDHMAEAIVERIGALMAHAPDEQDEAVQRLRGVGQGYIAFALAEPGWFALALLTFDDSEGPMVTTGAQAPAPFLLLVDALDRCAETGALPAEAREHAEWPCWSAVHGFADLATRGPLQCQSADELAALGAHVVDRIIAGVGIGATALAP